MLKPQFLKNQKRFFLFSFTILTFLFLINTSNLQAVEISADKTTISIGSVTLRFERGWQRDAQGNYVAEGDVVVNDVIHLESSRIVYNPRTNYLEGEVGILANTLGSWGFAPIKTKIKVDPAKQYLLFDCQQGLRFTQVPGGIKLGEFIGFLEIDIPQERFAFKGSISFIELFGIDLSPESGAFGLILDKPKGYFYIEGAGSIKLPEIGLELDIEGSLEVDYQNQRFSGQGKVGTEFVITLGEIDFTVDIPNQDLAFMARKAIDIGELASISQTQEKMHINIKTGDYKVIFSRGTDIKCLNFALTNFQGTATLNVKDLYSKGINYDGSCTILNYQINKILAKYDLRQRKISGTLTFSFPLIQGINQEEVLSFPFVWDVSQSQFILEATSGALKGIVLAGFPLKDVQFSLQNDGVHLSGKLEFVNLSGVSTPINVVVKSDSAQKGIVIPLADFVINLGNISSATLKLSNANLNQNLFSGRGEVSFSNIVGIDRSFTCDFLLTKDKAEINFPGAIQICTLDVYDARLQIKNNALSGSGKIRSPSGTTIEVKISIENGMFVIRDRVGKLIAKGLKVMEEFAGLAKDLAEEESEIIAEGAEQARQNLQRMTQPWVQEMLKSVNEATGFLSNLSNTVNSYLENQFSKTLSQLASLIDNAKKAITEKIAIFKDYFVKLADGIINLINNIEGYIPSNFRSQYNALKNSLLDFYNNFKKTLNESISNLNTGIPQLTQKAEQLYAQAQGEIRGVSERIQTQIRTATQPYVDEINRCLLEVNNEMNAAKKKSAEEAEKHINNAKQKANQAKQAAIKITHDYKDQLSQLIIPYVNQLSQALKPYTEQINAVLKQATDEAMKRLKQTKDTIEQSEAYKSFMHKYNEFKGFIEKVGGKAIEEFNKGIDTLKKSLIDFAQKAGEEFKWLSDKAADIFVQITAVLADVSERIHALATTINQGLNEFLDSLRNGTVSFLDLIGRNLNNLKTEVNKKISEIKNAVGGSRTEEGVTITISPQGEISEIEAIKSIGDSSMRLKYANRNFSFTGKSRLYLGKYKCSDVEFNIQPNLSFSGKGKLDLPWLGSSEFSFSGSGNNFTARVIKDLTIAGNTQKVNFTVTPSSISGSAEFDLPLFGKTLVNFSGGPLELSASATKPITIAGKTQTVNLKITQDYIKGEADFDLPLLGKNKIYFSGDASYLKAKTQLNNFSIGAARFTGDFNINTDGSISAKGKFVLGNYTFSDANINVSSQGIFSISASSTFNIGGVSRLLTLKYENEKLFAESSRGISLGPYSFADAKFCISSEGNVSLEGKLSQTFTIPGVGGGITFNLKYVNGELFAEGTTGIALGNYNFSGAYFKILSNGIILIDGKNQAQFPAGGPSFTFNL
ncbi:MAG: hypothetical protein NC936_04370, partial [Candidatus Omnitrophica bacterium]|nr:hypothetical protein [Candidatus Omnitrophota bacterium]